MNFTIVPLLLVIVYSEYFTQISGFASLVLLLLNDLVRGAFVNASAYLVD